MEEMQADNNIFINLTNHPSNEWSNEQLLAAEKYGKVIDILFPNVPADAGTDDIRELCDIMVDKVMSYHPVIVLCQGEFTLAFKIINRLMDNNVMVVAACSERIAVVNGNKKESYFNFTQFRAYDR